MGGGISQVLLEFLTMSSSLHRVCRILVCTAPSCLSSFLPFLFRACTSSNILLLNPRDLTQAFIGDVAGDHVALWPTHCCRTHGGCPYTSAHAS